MQFLHGMSIALLQLHSKFILLCCAAINHDYGTRTMTMGNSITREDPAGTAQKPSASLVSVTRRPRFVLWLNHDAQQWRYRLACPFFDVVFTWFTQSASSSTVPWSTIFGSVSRWQTSMAATLGGWQQKLLTPGEDNDFPTWYRIPKIEGHRIDKASAKNFPSWNYGQTV